MSNALNTTAPKIPYGRADFRGIRLDGSLYVDKTRFVRELENHSYVLFIRPRRFGKTCWLSTLECYYDRRAKDDFEAVFGGTEIGAKPTANRSRYVVLRLNFSRLRRTDGQAGGGVRPLLPSASARHLGAPPRICFPQTPSGTSSHRLPWRGGSTRCSCTWRSTAFPSTC